MEEIYKLSTMVLQKIQFVWKAVAILFVGDGKRRVWEIELRSGENMAKNKDFANCRKARKDEFYTQLTDIEKELRHYRRHFALARP